MSCLLLSQQVKWKHVFTWGYGRVFRLSTAAVPFPNHSRPQRFDKHECLGHQRLVGVITRARYYVVVWCDVLWYIWYDMIMMQMMWLTRMLWYCSYDANDMVLLVWYWWYSTVDDAMLLMLCGWSILYDIDVIGRKCVVITWFDVVLDWLCLSKGATVELDTTALENQGLLDRFCSAIMICYQIAAYNAIW